MKKSGSLAITGDVGSIAKLSGEMTPGKTRTGFGTKLGTKRGASREEDGMEK